MDTKPQNELVEVLPNAGATRRLELRYNCGCSTLRIEHLRSRPTTAAGCSGHGGELVKTIETIEYKTLES